MGGWNITYFTLLDTEWNAEWFPPGIHYSCKIEKAEAKHAATSSSQEGHMEWMASDEVSSKDLHQAMH